MNSTYSRLQRSLAIIAAIGCGALWAFENASTVMAHVSHDAGWDLYAANAVLHGVHLDGSRLIEVNPPFLVWFFMLPTLLARALHISLAAGFRTFFIVSATVLIAWSASLYRRVCKASSLSTWLFLLCIMYIVTGPISLEDRGQREYFAALMLLPYVLWAAARIRNEVLSHFEAGLLAIFAALAICLKPQHMIDVLAVELLVLLRLRNLRKWFRPALLLIAAGPPLYLLIVLYFVPSYVRSVVPLLSDTYWGFDQSWGGVVHGAMKPLAAMLVLVVMYAALHRRLRVEPFIACLLAASTGALIAYLQQHKGWSYQVLVVEIFSYLAVAVLCLDIAERMAFERDGPRHLGAANHRQTFALVGVAILSFVAVGAVRLSHMRPIGYPQNVKSQLAEIYAPYPPGTPVGLLAVDPWEWPEVLEQNKVWSSRYMHLWMLPAIVRSQDPLDEETAHHLSSARINALSSLLRQTTAEDLQHWRPPVVVIDPCGVAFNICAGLSRAGYSGMLDWFSRDPRFREQWSHYRFQNSVGDLQVYTRID